VLVLLPYFQSTAIKQMGRFVIRACRIVASGNLCFASVGRLIHGATLQIVMQECSNNTSREYSQKLWFISRRACSFEMDSGGDS
jgi:hypothetical protein